ncbi:MAG: Fic family protein [Atopobiaceae bacterium]|nr:Fic family protein [Atopobiaceae bacterium]
MDTKTAYQASKEWWAELDADEQNKLLDRFAIDYSYNSVRIENDEVTPELTRDVMQKGQLSNFSGSLKTLYELHGHAAAYTMMRADTEHERPFDEDYILDVHRALAWGTYDERQIADGERPGSYRSGDYLIAGLAAAGAAAEDCPALIRELCAEVQEALADLNPRHAFIIACYFHCSYEAIHPFSDASGTSGRMLMNHLLLLGGHPPIIIFAEDKKAYFSAIEAFARTGDLEPFKEFLTEQCAKTWRDRAWA